MLDPTPSPNTPAADYVRSKPAVTRAVWEALAPDLQAKAFFITGVECLATVARVRDLAASLPEGGDYKDLKDQITAELSPYLVTSSDPEERAKQQAAAARRAEVILRMHGFQAYARTQDAMLRAHIDVFPYCVYLASPDDRVRPAHAALHGKIIPTDHQFWDNHTPPWEFGCRCDKAGMSREDVEEIREAEAGKAPEDQRVLGPEQLKQLTEHQRLVAKGGAGFIDVRTPRQKKGNGYEWRVRDEAASVEQVIGQMIPEAQAAFEELAANTELSDGRTLLDWWRPDIALPKTSTAPAKASSTIRQELELALTGQVIVSSVISPTEALPPASRALLLTREDAIRHATVEHASLFRPGIPRQDFVGTANKAVLPLEVITQDGIYTHVHPAGWSFSVEDVAQLFDRRLLEVRALARHGTYSVFPTTRWRLGKVLSRIDKLLPQMQKELSKISKTTTETERAKAGQHLLWILLANEDLIRYSYRPMKSQFILDPLATPDPSPRAGADARDGGFITPPVEDYTAWLRGEAGFPQLAEVTARHQRRLAAGLEPPEN